ncbi:uncharacterized protein V6R79_001819 [Siganus canaliculatus]
MAGSYSRAAGTCSVTLSVRVSSRVAPRPRAGLFPMGPPGRGVSSAPRASQDQRWLLEVQPHTSHHIYGAASLVLLTILCPAFTATQRHPQQRLLLLPLPASAMEANYCSPLQLQEESFLFDCESLLDKSYNPLVFDPASDPGYFSAGSSLSPTSSVDSSCFSPTFVPAAGSEQNPLDCFVFSSPTAPSLTNETQNQPCSRSSTTTSTTTKKSRSKFPGKKRQTASEREKLRMRDLTKAMHHLRLYLPSSVAPVGQTLTKIEILRLTIRYISYLSAQLGISEEALEQQRSSGSVEQAQTLNQFLGQTTTNYSQQESASMSSSQPSYQVSSGASFTSEQYWMLQQQLHNFAFQG